MKVYFVTRHKDAVEWAQRRGIAAEHVEHFDPKTTQPGNMVHGTLPVSVVARVCERGGRYGLLRCQT